MERFANTTIVKKQLLDGNQLQKLALTLGRPSLGGRLMTESPPPTGCPVPPGYHLVYFTPSDLENELGADGSDRSANPPGKFTRRMWAGGEMFWPAALANGDEAAVLKVGEEVEERTTLLSATPKHSSRSGDMILVDVRKELWTPKGLAVTDKRSWIFRQELDPSQSANSNSSRSAGARELHTRSRMRDSTNEPDCKKCIG
jgi:hydroxyacyl-ACP dehydratase HTD2-like protein with hotdog domain